MKFSLLLPNWTSRIIFTQGFSWVILELRSRAKSLLNEKKFCGGKFTYASFPEVDAYYSVSEP